MKKDKRSSEVTNQEIVDEIFRKILDVIQNSPKQDPPPYPLTVIFPQKYARKLDGDLNYHLVVLKYQTLRQRIEGIAGVSRVITSPKVKEITVWSPHMTCSSEDLNLGLRCPICNALVSFMVTDQIAGVVCEQEYLCNYCGLYNYQFAYGNTEKMIGFVDICYGWEQNVVSREFEELTKSTIDETRKMYQDSRLTGWFRHPKDARDQAWKASLADRLMEIAEYPLNCEALSNLAKQEVA